MTYALTSRVYSLGRYLPVKPKKKRLRRYLTPVLEQEYFDRRATREDVAMYVNKCIQQAVGDGASPEYLRRLKAHK